MASRSAAPEVFVAGAGVAGLAAAHRLLQRGYDVTLLEANDYVGGKLGAHREIGVDCGTGQGHGHGDGTDASVCGCGASSCLRASDWHEHCYHMYLNWYHNFWDFMAEIGTLEKFAPINSVATLLRSAPGAARPAPVTLVNVGSPWTTLRNVFSGIGSVADVLASTQATADLAGEFMRSDAWLEQTSITSYMHRRLYATDEALASTGRTTAQAFASPSYLSSARSYKALLNYGLRRPAPQMYLLRDPTGPSIFTPWLTEMRRISSAFALEGKPITDPLNPLRVASETSTAPGPGGRLTIRPLTLVKRVDLDETTGRITSLHLQALRRSPFLSPKGEPEPEGEVEIVPVVGDVILAVPPRQLGALVSPQIARLAPQLFAKVRNLRMEPMISLDLFFRKKLNGIPQGITSLQGTVLELSLLDTSQSWETEPHLGTSFNIIASTADTIIGYDNATILELILQELAHYIDFDRADIIGCRTHLQTNVGAELFVNQLGSWDSRPQATCGIPNLFIAGDYCKTPVDVVTIEGAVMSGLIAAEALRRRRKGIPIKIHRPDSYPVQMIGAMAAATRPVGYAAFAAATADRVISTAYTALFPNG